MARFWQRLKSFVRETVSGPRRLARAGRGPQSRIDAARTTDDNRYRWASADALGPNAAFDETTRANLRNRSRSETLNNGYCKALVRAKARDLVGTGPRLQLTIPGVGFEKTKIVERRFAEWAKAVQLPRKLRVMESSAVRDGEIFGLLDTDPDLECPVKLEITLLEAEQCATPFEFAAERDVIDGVRHRQGKPVTFYFYVEHPGERFGLGGPLAAWFAAPAKRVLHWYRQDRANQLRGIPETTPALPIFNQIRRYRAAVLDAAEFAASHSGILYTDLPAEEGVRQTDVERFEIVDVVRNALKCMPHGWKLEQLEAKQPIDKFGEFNRENLNEAGRSAEAPLNIVTGNSSGYNFTSGRLDHLPYQRGEWVDRDDCETIVTDRIVRAWAEEALQIQGYLPEGLPSLSEWTIAFNWDAFDELDPLKSAQADGQRLRDGTTTMAEVDAGRGLNWRDKADQLAEEVSYYRSKGLVHPFDAQAQAKAAPALVPAPDPVDPDQEDDAENEKAARHRRNGHAAVLIGGVN